MGTTFKNHIDQITAEHANFKMLAGEKYLYLCFNREFFEDAVWEATGKRDTIKKLECSPSPQLQQTIALFESEVENLNGYYSLMIQSICMHLAMQLIRCTENDAIGPKKYAQENNYVSKAIDYMQAYYNAGISINDICREINLSPFYFIRLFKARTGKTPYKYLLEIRLQHAEALLKRGGYSVEEVARLCGFVNSGHFSALFRRSMGITPSEYMKKTEC